MDRKSYYFIFCSFYIELILNNWLQPTKVEEMVTTTITQLSTEKFIFSLLFLYIVHWMNLKELIAANQLIDTYKLKSISNAQNIISMKNKEAATNC